MFIAFVAAQSTGKTTTATALQKALREAQGKAQGKECALFSDYYRKIGTQLGYERPLDLILEDPAYITETATSMAATALGAQLQFLEQTKGHGVIDVGPLNLMAYPAYRLNLHQQVLPPYIEMLVKECHKLIDWFVYLPLERIPLEDDGVRSDDPQFQRDIDLLIRNYLQKSDIPAEKLLKLKSVSVDERVQEIIQQTGI